MKRVTPAIVLRALRLPFVAASLLPFLAGSLHAGQPLRGLRLLLGLLMVAANHLAANLLNDYADSRSGADWADRRFFGYFGGSKLIQEGVLSERFYVLTALALFASAFGLAAGLSRLMGSPLILVLYGIIFLLSWSYSARPLRLAYRQLGEVTVFLLFGPALVMGGMTIQAGSFPVWSSFWLSVPFGLMTAAILFANEVPDYPQDRAAGKFTLVHLTTPRFAYRLYAFLMAGAFAAISADVIVGNCGWLALGALLLVLPAYRATRVLRADWNTKEALVLSSRLTIACQAQASLILVLDQALRWFKVYG